MKDSQVLIGAFKALIIILLVAGDCTAFWYIFGLALGVASTALNIGGVVAILVLLVLNYFIFKAVLARKHT